MASLGTRPLVQDLVKSAMQSAVDRARLSAEHARQVSGESEKRASAPASSSNLSTDYVMKLASAVEHISKTANFHLGSGSADTTVVPHSPASGKGKAFGIADLGHAHEQPPMHPGLQKGLHQEHSATQMDNTLDHPPGGSGHQTTAMSGGQGKTASARLYALAGITKVAEDAINPAQISAGPAVKPDTNEAGEAGGEPAGGAPQGPTGLIGSNEAAIKFKKDQAYAPRKTEMAAYVKEPMMSSATDPVLQRAWDHTGEAGVKISSADTARVAAARALISKLAAEAKKD